jgi:TonB-linked SusC/RagA family outer membrane protein
MSSWSTAGYFGRLNYNYKGRYLIEGNLRYDGTSKFRGNSRWAWLPSFSAGWNVAQESFWSSLGLDNKISLLKLRGSYGELGNQNTVGNYVTYTTISPGSTNGPWLQNGVKVGSVSSPDLIDAFISWERIHTVNFGLDLGALRNRLTASFDTYVRNTYDMVGPAPTLPVILGKGVPKTNNTDLRTKGFELSLGWRDRLANGLSYGAKFLLSDSRSVITNYPNETMSLGTWYTGQVFGEIWGFETIGMARTQEQMDAHLASLPKGGQDALGSKWAAGDMMYRDRNGDEKVSRGADTKLDPGDRIVIGNDKARYSFGMDLNAAWKGFDLRAFFQGVGKRDFNPNNNPTFFGAVGGVFNSAFLKEHLNYFRAEAYGDLPANPNGYYPRVLESTGNKNQANQTYWMQNAAYIRLKNVTLGYTIPANIVRQVAISNVRVFFSADNIWTGTKMAKMFDPEATGAYAKGASYPLSRVVSLGLNVSF